MRWRQRGSTLLEALVATALLLATVWLAAQWQIDTRTLAENARRRSHAAWLRQQRLEQLRAQTLDGGAAAGGADQVADLGGIGYRCRWRTETNSNTGLWALEVEIAWPDATGQRQTLTGQALVHPAAWQQPAP